VVVTLARRGTQIELAVADSGQGIAPDVLPHVFDPVRPPARLGRSPGFGLGLSLVRHLVEVHGGRIRADSAGEGQGATFTITLPLHAPAAERTAAVGSRDVA
jgi:signal transduction histidine kinase